MITETETKIRPPLSWERCDLGGNLSSSVPVLQFAEYTSNGTVLGVLPSFVAYSRDFALSWTRVPTTGLAPEGVLTSIGYNGYGIYVGAFEGVYHRRDLGPNQPWVNQADQWAVSTMLGRNPSQPVGVIYAGLRSSDTGLSSTAVLSTPNPLTGWAGLDGYPPITSGSCPVEISASGRHLLIGNSTLGVHASHGGPCTLIGLAGRMITSVATIQHTTKGSFHFAGTVNAGLYRSPYNNPSFTFIAPSVGMAGQGRAVAYAMDSTLVADFAGEGVFYSNACGETNTWQRLNIGLPQWAEVWRFGRVGTYLLASIKLPSDETQIYRINMSQILAAADQ